MSKSSETGEIRLDNKEPKMLITENFSQEGAKTAKKTEQLEFSPQPIKG